MAEKDREEHHVVSVSQYHTAAPILEAILNIDQVKEKLKAFQKLKSGTAEFIPTLKSLMNDLAEHIKRKRRQIYQ